MQDPFLFAAAVLAILWTPGPTNTLLATAGATRGFRHSLPLIPAEAAGYAISILVLLWIGRTFNNYYLLWPMMGAAIAALVWAGERERVPPLSEPAAPPP